MRWLVALAVIAAPSITSADSIADSQRHIDKATALHEQNQLAEASAELAVAYALDPKPELLFAIGQVELKQGNCGLAIAFYTRFLATGPASDGGAADAIETCKKQQPALDARTESKRRIEVATSLHERSEYANARGQLVVAYALEPAPPLLFAIGQLHVKLENCEDAIPFYERFIASARSGSEGADEATEAIRVCKDRLAKPVEPTPEPEPPKPPPPPPPVAPPPQAEPSRWYSSKLTLSLLGGGVAFAAAGTFMYLGALSDLDAADSATTYPRHVELVDDARGKRTFAAAFGAGAIALTGVAIWRIVVHGRSETHGVAIVPRAGGGVLTWTAGF